MNENASESQRAVLDYASPSNRQGHPVLGVLIGVFGVFALMVALIALLVGILGIIYGVTSKKGVVWEYLFMVAIVLLISGVSFYLGIRSCRAVRGLIAGK